jgi:hypothetical protein
MNALIRVVIHFFVAHSRCAAVKFSGTLVADRKQVDGGFYGTSATSNAATIKHKALEPLAKLSQFDGML